MAPIVRGRKGEFRKELEKLARQGFVKARIDGVIRSLEDEISLDKRRNHTIEVIVDRLLVKPGIEKRLEASIETATRLANGLVLISVVDGEERLYSQKLACVECGTSVPELEPRSFSFNSPYGACEECAGIGSTWAFDPDKVIVDPAKPLLEGALGPGAGIQPGDEQSPGGGAVAAREAEDIPGRSCRAATREALLNTHRRDARRHLPRCVGRLSVSGSRSTCRLCPARPAAASVCGLPAWRCASRTSRSPSSPACRFRAL